MGVRQESRAVLRADHSFRPNTGIVSAIDFFSSHLKVALRLLFQALSEARLGIVLLVPMQEGKARRGGKVQMQGEHRVLEEIESATGARGRRGGNV